MNVVDITRQPRLREVINRYAVTIVPAAFWWSAFLLGLGLFGRIMTYPLGHDEEIHVAAGRLLFEEPLYARLGYNHLPGLPLLLHGFYALTGSEHLLQSGRVLIFLGWLATVVIVWQLARRQTGEMRIAAVGVLVLMAGTLMGPAGMLVTNNLLPIPFALLGLHLFLIASEGERVRPALVFAAGAAIGFAVSLKISFVFLLPPFAVAAVLVPRDVSARDRAGLLILPLIAGGIIGGSPALVPLLSDPGMMYEHTVRYFTVGHLAYWNASIQPKAMSFGAKLVVAEDVWFAGSGLLAAVLVGVATVFLARRNPTMLRTWQILLVASLALCGAVISFVPTPAFPQYYEPPVPFLIALFFLIYRQLDHPVRAKLKPVLISVGALAVVMIVPRMLVDVPLAVQRSRWTGSVVNEEAQRLAGILKHVRMTGKVATLAPILALEAGLPTYPEFAAGPFVYRVADYLPPAHRAQFLTTSPHGLAAFLDHDPPALIVTGFEPEFDAAFEAYARSRGYREAARTDYAARVFVRSSSMPALVANAQ